MLGDAGHYTLEQLRNRRIGLPPFPGMSAEDSERIRARIDDANIAVQTLNDEHIAEMKGLVDRAEDEGWIEITFLAAQHVLDRRFSDRLTDLMDHMWSEIDCLRESALARGSREKWERHTEGATLQATIQAVVDARYPLPERRRR